MIIRKNTILAAALSAFLGISHAAADRSASAPSPVPRAVTEGESPAAPGAGASDPTRAAVGPRVGGSAADAEFRSAMQKTGADFRRARTECRKQASDQRRSCIRNARAKMEAARAAAKTRHDQEAIEAKASGR